MIADLKPGDHLCCLYETEEEHRAVLAPFLRQGLERGEKVVYIIDAHTAGTVLGYLREDGLDVEPYLARGQLSILTVGDAYMREGVFDPDGMVALLQAETERALAEGYSALRVTGEMSWALRGLPGSERLIEYETRLNGFFPGSKCLAICQYDWQHFDPAVLLDVLRAHPIAVVGTAVYDNFYYMPAAEFLGGDLPAAELRRCVQNLAERKRAEEALRESEEKHRTLIETITDIIFTLDKEGKFTYLNPRFEEITGYPIQDFLGHSFTGILGHEYIESGVDKFKRALSGETIPVCDFDLIHKHGRRVTVELNMTSLLDGDGKPIGMIGAARDVTKRKKAEEALKQKMQQQDVLLSSIPVFVYYKDTESNLITANKAFAAMVNTPIDQLPGKDAYDLFPKEQAEKFHTDDRKVMGSGKPMMNIEERFTDAEGKTRWASTSKVPYFDEEGKVAGMVGICIDITERKRAEEELESSRQQLRNLGRYLESAREGERSRIARELHDDMGQALTALKMDLSWLNKTLSKDQISLREKTTSMSKLIDTAIQTVKRISTELRPGILDDLGLTAAIEWQAEEFQNRTGIKCETSLYPEDISLDQVLSTAVFRILQETLTNVARHAQAMKVKISLNEKAGKLVLEVVDDGKGITQEQISDPKSLGLVGMRERILPWHGEVRISGIPGEGTTVTATIPLGEKEKSDDKDTYR